MDTIYFDNAATTPLLPEVIDEMYQTEKEFFGNPSSTHFAGRKSKNKIEMCRRNIAQHFGAIPSEITFTSGATEANNIILSQVIKNLDVQTVITSEIEHKAVLEPIKRLKNEYNVNVIYVKHDEKGHIDYNNLKEILSSQAANGKTLVSLMGANNEIGNLLDFEKIKALKNEFSFYFHSDTVQVVGHEKINFSESGIDFATCSAHKFHGPKNVGFMYCTKSIAVAPVFYGGGQERGIKPGTENIAGIVGMDLALNLALETLAEDQAYVKSLKNYFIEQVNHAFAGKTFINGDVNNSLNTILNLGFDKNTFPQMLLFTLDMKNIAISGGSACSSGSDQGSHVIQYIYGSDYPYIPIRFSFSKLNNTQEIDACIAELKNI